MSLTSSIYDWAAARVDERDLVEIMRKHGYSIRRTDGRPVAARPVPDDVKRQFDEEVDRLVKEASCTLVRLDYFVRSYHALAKRYGIPATRGDVQAFRQRMSDARHRLQTSNRLDKRARKQKLDPATILLRTSFTKARRTGADHAWNWYASTCRTVGQEPCAREKWLEEFTRFQVRGDDEAVDAKSPLDTDTGTMIQ